MVKFLDDLSHLEGFYTEGMHELTAGVVQDSSDYVYAMEVSEVKDLPDVLQVVYEIPVGANVAKASVGVYERIVGRSDTWKIVTSDAWATEMITELAYEKQEVDDKLLAVKTAYELYADGKAATAKTEAIADAKTYTDGVKTGLEQKIATDIAAHDLLADGKFATIVNLGLLEDKVDNLSTGSAARDVAVEYNRDMVEISTNGKRQGIFIAIQGKFKPVGGVQSLSELFTIDGRGFLAEDEGVTITIKYKLGTSATFASRQLVGVLNNQGEVKLASPFNIANAKEVELSYTIHTSSVS